MCEIAERREEAREERKERQEGKGEWRTLCWQQFIITKAGDARKGICKPQPC